MARSKEKTGEIVINGAPVPVHMRVSRRARRLALSVDISDDGVKLVLPPGTSYREGLKFAEGHATWLGRQLDALPSRVPFEPGAEIPLLGQTHVISHRPTGRGGVWIEDGEICVAGKPEHVARRVRDWLRRTARHELSERALRFAAEAGVKVIRITVRDTKSRWGSCSSTGSLSFSWRVIFTPPHVADYIVAHEVAHLVEMNHSRQFWDLVEDLADQVETAKEWIKFYGNGLHKYG